MPVKTKPDYLALVVGLVSIVLQMSVWVFWGGRLSQTMLDIQKRQDATEVALAATNLSVAEQKLNIAVLGTKLDNIKSVVDTVNGKLTPMRDTGR